MHFKKIIGEKVYLSPVIEDDLDYYIQWMNNPEITDNIGRSEKVTNQYNNRQFFDDILKNGKYVFSIINLLNEKVLGCCGVNDINWIHGTCEIFIYIGNKDDMGKGYAKDCLKILINYVFNILNINNILIKAFDFNTAAISLYKKVGFKNIGVRRNSHYINNDYHDIYYFDMLKTDFLNL